MSQLFTITIATISIKDKIDFLYVIGMRYTCLGTDFELPSHDFQSQFYFLFKIELFRGAIKKKLPNFGQCSRLRDPPPIRQVWTQKVLTLRLGSDPPLTVVWTF